MSELASTGRDPALQALVDRQDITDTLYRYASTIDAKDYTGLRAVFTDDARGKYGVDRAWLEGADTIVEWIAEYGKAQSWQHHLLSVYHVDVEGDSARAVTYHTSHQVSVAEPDQVNLIVARYYDVLRRVDDKWKICEKVMQVGWRENRLPPPPKA